jgi:hypothetical protein
MKAYTIPAHRRGDTWNGINTISFTASATPLNFSGASVKMEFRQKPDYPVTFTFSTENNQIQFVDASKAIIRIMPQIIEVPPGKYYYDLQVIYPNSVVKTYMVGTWNIFADITK